MYRDIAKLIMYGDIDEDCILYQMGEIFREFEEGTQSNAVLIRKVYTQIKRLLTVATDFGFDKNLWHNYLAYFLITNENPFSITCEKIGANDGSVNHFARNDFSAIKNLFEYDFSEIEKSLGIDCFTQISNYRAIEKKELMYNKNVSEKVQALSSQYGTGQRCGRIFYSSNRILQRLWCWHVWSEQSVPYPGSYRQQTCIFTDQQYGQSYAV